MVDAKYTLSLQGHPPAAKAAQLGGEPKTEMWHITAAAPGAELFVGLKRGVSRAEFERRIQDGSVANCFHRVPVVPGDTMFLPSGRVHALGAGIVMFEIQQNSDTTYRVFDWNRVGLDGKPRELHVAQSLASIDFEDFEPALVGGGFAGEWPARSRVLVRDPLFTVEEWQVEAGADLPLRAGVMQIIACVTGRLLVAGEMSVELAAGQFALVPASLEEVVLRARPETRLLRIEAGG